MRNEKVLIKVLRSVVDLLGEEATRNPAFAERLREIALGSSPKTAKSSTKGPDVVADLPDIHAEWSRRGEIDFRIWLRDQPIAVLRALIRTQDFDSARRTSRWKESDKLAGFIADSLRTRLAKGASFLVRREGE